MPNEYEVDQLWVATKSRVCTAVSTCLARTAPCFPRIYHISYFWDLILVQGELSPLLGVLRTDFYRNLKSIKGPINIMAVIQSWY